MSLDAHAHLRVALYSADGAVVGILTGALATVQANTPKGGTWRILPDAVRRFEQAPPAASLPPPD